MSVHPLFQDLPQKQGLALPGRAATLSAQLVAEIRQALFEKRLRPGDFLGGEQDIANQRGVSRIVARDALRTLEALGIVEIKVGSGGGARIARGDPRRFAEALAVQLELAGTDVAEIMDAQRAVEALAAELAAEHATKPDIARLKTLLAEGDRALDDVAGFTRNGADFHLAIAEASHNRVLVVQLQSLQHVSWPVRNPTLTHDVAAHVQEAHRDLVKLIEMRDPGGARRVMDDHVKMIRARRIAEHGAEATDINACC
ncbi:MAG TPA: FCD domain-containing protein [Stellaceae bacterium]|nr:FCD domain-containing protein [Stellaceae bacterium]